MLTTNERDRLETMTKRDPDWDMSRLDRKAIKAALAEIDRLTAALAVHEEDIKSAAGELRVPILDLSDIERRILRANSIMRRERDEALAALADERWATAETIAAACEEETEGACDQVAITFESAAAIARSIGSKPRPDAAGADARNHIGTSTE